MIFKNARGPFLSFLRNIGPQIGLVTIAIIFGINLTKEFRLSTLICIVLLMLTFAYATYANISIFIEESCKSIQGFEAKKAKLFEEKMKWWPRSKLIFQWLRKEHKGVFVEIILIIAVMEIGIIMVFLTALPAAENIYEKLHGKAPIKQVICQGLPISPENGATSSLKK